jgi:hypothetical protein
LEPPSLERIAQDMRDVDFVDEYMDELDAFLIRFSISGNRLPVAYAQWLDIIT